jgi:hypothetical protein
VILLLASCASSPIDLSESQSLPQDEGIVFGRVKVFDGEEEKKLSLFGESKFSLIILPDHSSEAIYVPLKNIGRFAWHLPAGGYTIASFEWRSYGVLRGRVFADFSAPANRATYIGTLAILFAGEQYAIYLIDEFEDSYKAFEDNFPDWNKAVVKHLMQLEERR